MEYRQPNHGPKKSYKDNLKCPACDATKGPLGDLTRLFVYDPRYDCWMCPEHATWLESRCSDPECTMCSKRPEKAYK